jgi:hypothetical protein
MSGCSLEKGFAPHKLVPSAPSASTRVVKVATWIRAAAVSWIVAVAVAWVIVAIAVTWVGVGIAAVTWVRVAIAGSDVDY